MASIKYVTILNSFVSTEGSGGFMTNYIYYSLLVTYDDGSRSIVEGKANQIGTLLSYVRTPVDELMKMNDQLQIIRQLIVNQEELSQMIDEKLYNYGETMYHIPDVIGQTESAAVETLKAADLIPFLTRMRDVPGEAEQIVYSCERDSKHWRKIDLQLGAPLPNVELQPADEAVAALRQAGFSPRVIYRCAPQSQCGLVLKCIPNTRNPSEVSVFVGRLMPDVEDLPMDEAAAILKQAGFNASIRYRQSDAQQNMRVIRCTPLEDQATTVELLVGRSLDPRVERFLAAIQFADRYRILLEQWATCGLKGDPKFSEAENFIQKHFDIERMYGPKKDSRAFRENLEKLKDLLNI